MLVTILISALTDSLPKLCVLSLSLLYCAWTLWTFTISPLVFPRMPRKAWYWIPWLGNAIQFVRDSNEVIEKSRRQLSPAGEPFSVVIGGQEIYILTSPEDASFFYRNVQDFSWDEYLDLLLQNYDLEAKERARAWLPRGLDQHKATPSPDSPAGAKKSLIHTIEDIFIAQLLPGPRMSEFVDCFLTDVSHTLQWQNLTGSYVVDSAADDTWRLVSLRTLIRAVVTESTTLSLFGPTIFHHRPELTKHMLCLNDTAWAIAYKYPKFLIPGLRQARAYLLDTLKAYQSTTDEQRQGQCWAIKSVINSQTSAGLSKDASARMILMMWWAAHSNTGNATFWLFAYILYDPELLQAIRDETKHAMQQGERRVNWQSLIDGCELLDAIWHEVLRLVNGANSVRKVLHDCTVSGKLLKKGHLVLVPFRALHYNQRVWGARVGSLDPQRFMNKPKMKKHDAYRPFGGGKSFCPGRHTAKADVCGLVVMLIHSYDIHLVPGSDGQPRKFPVLDTTKPSMGITDCRSDMDMMIKLTPMKTDACE